MGSVISIVYTTLETLFTSNNSFTNNSVNRNKNRVNFTCGCSNNQNNNHSPSSSNTEEKRRGIEVIKDLNDDIHEYCGKINLATDAIISNELKLQRKLAALASKNNDARAELNRMREGLT